MPPSKKREALPYIIDEDEIDSFRRREQELEDFGDDTPRLMEDGSIVLKNGEILIRPN